MKSALFFISFILVTINSSWGQQVPSCWDNPRVKEGQYIIRINTDQLQKDELLELMNLASGKYIQARRYPVIFDDVVFITVESYDSGVGEYRLTKSELQLAVEKELSIIAEFNGVSIECNAIFRL